MSSIEHAYRGGTERPAERLHPVDLQPWLMLFGDNPSRDRVLFSKVGVHFHHPILQRELLTTNERLGTFSTTVHFRSASHYVLLIVLLLARHGSGEGVDQ